MLGYYNMPAATAGAMRNMWFHSGIVGISMPTASLFRRSKEGSDPAAGRKYFRLRDRNDPCATPRRSRDGCRAGPPPISAKTMSWRSSSSARAPRGTTARSSLLQRGTWPTSWSHASSTSSIHFPKTASEKIEKYKLKTWAQGEQGSFSGIARRRASSLPGRVRRHGQRYRCSHGEARKRMSTRSIREPGATRPGGISHAVMAHQLGLTLDGDLELGTGSERRPRCRPGRTAGSPSFAKGFRRGPLPDRPAAGNPMKTYFLALRCIPPPREARWQTPGGDGVRRDARGVERRRVIERETRRQRNDRRFRRTRWAQHLEHAACDAGRRLSEGRDQMCRHWPRCPSFGPCGSNRDFMTSGSSSVGTNLPIAPFEDVMRMRCEPFYLGAPSASMRPSPTGSSPRLSRARFQIAERRESRTPSCGLTGRAAEQAREPRSGRSPLPPRSRVALRRRAVARGHQAPLHRRRGGVCARLGALARASMPERQPLGEAGRRWLANRRLQPGTRSFDPT